MSTAGYARLLALVATLTCACGSEEPAGARPEEPSKATAARATPRSPRPNESAPPAFAPPASDRSEVGAIQAAHQAYADAHRARNGAAAAAHISDATVAFYERMRRLALHASRDELREASVMDRGLALTVRARLSEAELRQNTGRAFFALAVDREMMAAEYDEPLHVEEVRGDVAYGYYVPSGGRPHAPARPLMVREHGAWRIDLQSDTAEVAELVEEQLKGLASLLGTDVDDAILRSIENQTGREIDDSIWEPPAPR